MCIRDRTLHYNTLLVRSGLPNATVGGGGIGSYALGGDLYGPDGITELPDGLILQSNRLYWFGILHRRDHWMVAHGRTDPFPYNVPVDIHILGSGYLENIAGFQDPSSRV